MSLISCPECNHQARVTTPACPEGGGHAFDLTRIRCRYWQRLASGARDCGNRLLLLPPRGTQGADSIHLRHFRHDKEAGA